MLFYDDLKIVQFKLLALRIHSVLVKNTHFGAECI